LKQQFTEDIATVFREPAKPNFTPKPQRVKKQFPFTSNRRTNRERGRCQQAGSFRA
jgi:hypothetical protein